MKTTSFANWQIIVNGVRISGFSDDDDAFMAERRNDAASDKVGVDGHMFVNVSADKSGEITLKLFAAASSNAYLNSLYGTMESGPATMVPIQVRAIDAYRQDVAAAQAGYLKKLPALSRGGTVQVQPWVIVCERLDIVFGDPSFAGFATAVAEAI
jgi:hypothetical protein